jgi:hypothetical protein
MIVDRPGCGALASKPERLSSCSGSVWHRRSPNARRLESREADTFGHSQRCRNSLLARECSVASGKFLAHTCPTGASVGDILTDRDRDLAWRHRLLDRSGADADSNGDSPGGARSSSPRRLKIELARRSCPARPPRIVSRGDRVARPPAAPRILLSDFLCLTRPQVTGTSRVIDLEVPPRARGAGS